MNSSTRACALALTLSAAATSSCKRVEETPSAPPPVSAPAPAPTLQSTPKPLSARLSRPAPDRLAAVGDLHGDLEHARRAFRLAGAIDEHDHWVGGKLVLVQTGDEIDRGDDDRAILDWVETLKKEASGAGGEVIALLGNHEIMNAALDFRYVTGGGFEAFSLFDGKDAAVPSQISPAARGRAAAFLPGGRYARLLASRPFMVKVGDSVFVHGGILPKHVDYGLDKIDSELDAWLEGTRPEPPAILVADDGPVWTRAYSSEDSPPDCTRLAKALAGMGAKRMVVGHTVQKAGINSACDGAIWRIDVGLSRYFNGPIEALEVKGDDVKRVREATRR